MIPVAGNSVSRNLTIITGRSGPFSVHRSVLQSRRLSGNTWRVIHPTVTERTSFSSHCGKSVRSDHDLFVRWRNISYFIRDDDGRHKRACRAEGREALSPPILPKMPAGDATNTQQIRFRETVSLTVKSRRGQDFTPYWRSSRHRFSK